MRLGVAVALGLALAPVACVAMPYIVWISAVWGAVLGVLP